MGDYTIEKYREYNGDKWLALQNGENIVFAKLSTLVKLEDDTYSLSYNSSNEKLKYFNVSDIDALFIKK